MDGLPEPLIRLSAFAGIFTAMALLEWLIPGLDRPELKAGLKLRRWATNIGMLLVSSLLLRVAFPLAATGVALYAELNGIGLLPALGLPPLAAGLIAFVLLDLAVWFEHWASHRIGLLWRIHKVHHADPGLDVTTALRFHPVEILVSMLWKSAVVLLLGAPAVAVLVFEIVLNGAAMFNHANLRLPPRLEQALRLFVVTPEMHRMHHSVKRQETDSNYGFNLSVWDRLFGTYTLPDDTGLEIGLPEHRDRKPVSLLWSLALPFRAQKRPKGK